MRLITNTDTSVFPYNDNYMVYDLDTRQYVLTVEGVASLLGINLDTELGDRVKSNAFVLEMSDIIYNYIYSYSHRSHIASKRHQIAKDEDLRELFKRTLLAQTRYAVRSGANLLGDMHGVNIERGKALDISKLRGNILVSAQAHNLLSQTGLLFSGYQYMYDLESSDDGSY